MWKCYNLSRLCWVCIHSTLEWLLQNQWEDVAFDVYNTEYASLKQATCDKNASTFASPKELNQLHDIHFLFFVAPCVIMGITWGSVAEKFKRLSFNGGWACLLNWWYSFLMEFFTLVLHQSSLHFGRHAQHLSFFTVLSETVINLINGWEYVLS